MSLFKPMLAAKIPDNDPELTRIRWPVLASPKLDGIRALVHPDKGLVSRRLKPIPNNFIREMLSIPSLHGFDGEIVLYEANGTPIDYNTVQSAIMTRTGEPNNFRYCIFDSFLTPDLPFRERMRRVVEYVKGLDPELRRHVIVLEQRLVYDLEELRHAANDWISAGYEGAIFRDPLGPYKYGRSTYIQGWMVKWVEWLRAEGVIVGFTEMEHNNNVATTDELGYTKRTSHKEHKVPMGTLGNVKVSTEWGILSVGSGFDFGLRDLIWKNQDAYLGKIITFKYKPHGTKNLPRHPIFMGFRSPIDM